MIRIERSKPRSEAGEAWWRAGPWFQFKAAAVLSLGLYASFTSLASAQEPSALEAARALEKTLGDAISRAEQSVVAIARYRKGRLPANAADGQSQALTPPRVGSRDEIAPNEYAAGVVIDRQGHILTNYHVLGDPAENDYRVWIRHRPFDAVDVRTVEHVAAGDPWTDLAVLKIEANDLEPIALGDAKALRKGQIVIALGNPYGIAKDGDVSASWGIVSNLGRSLPTAGASPPPVGDSLYRYGGLIQTDARLNMGSSGGALVNLQGEMVGLITAVADSDGYERSLGLAIPVDDLFRRTVETLRSGRKAEFGFLGVAPEDLPDVQRRTGRQGAVLSHVVAGTAAATAGLREGDVITHVDDVPVYDRDMLMHELGKQPVAAQIRLTAERGRSADRPGRTVQAIAKLSKRQTSGGQRPYSLVPDPVWRGLQIDYATALPQPLLRQIQSHLSADVNLAAFSVVHGSAAWNAGLRPGTLVSHVDGVRVATPGEFFAAVREKSGPVHIRRVAEDPAEIIVTAVKDAGLEPE